MEDNYHQLVELISEKSGVAKSEIERRIEAKQAKLAGLISKAGAAQIIAAELNINFDKQIIKISQIVPGMKKINLVGKIIDLFPIREYNKNGRSGRIASFVLADETSNTRVVLWDENHINLIDKGEVNSGDVIEILNGTLRNGEIHLASFSEIKISEKTINQVVVERPVIKKEIVAFNTNDNVMARAFILQMFEPRFFEICPECKRKINELKECNSHGKVIAERRALINFVIDDGSDSIRAVAFSEAIEKLMKKEELENPELFLLKKQELLGKEVLVSGQVRKNSMFNNNEFIVNDIKDVDISKLIEELER